MIQLSLSINLQRHYAAKCYSCPLQRRVYSGSHSDAVQHYIAKAVGARHCRALTGIPHGNENRYIYFRHFVLGHFAASINIVYKKG